MEPLGPPDMVLANMLFTPIALLQHEDKALGEIPKSIFTSLKCTSRKVKQMHSFPFFAKSLRVSGSASSPRRNTTSRLDLCCFSAFSHLGLFYESLTLESANV